MRVLSLTAVVVVALGTGAAAASIEVTNGAARPALRVDARGNAEVSWRADGVRMTLLVPPTGRVLPGGRLSDPDVSRRLGRGVVPMARVVRRTPDGYLWALQEWPRTPQEPPVLRLARWKGAPTKLTLAVSGDQLVGRATFGGRPVTGFTTTPTGRRLRINVYLDCAGCRGARDGWKRMLGVAPRRDGTYRATIRPEWTGTRYRATVAGPNRGAVRAPDARVFASG
jgi:hypothetical protein